MMITLPSNSKSKLVDAICNFVLSPPLPCHQPTWAWLCTLGYANWALNVFPLLKPTLNSLYNKVASCSFLGAPIFLNKQTTEDLLWFADQVEALEGVRVLEAEVWDACNASAIGLAFWSPSMLLVILWTLLLMLNETSIYSIMKQLPYLQHLNGPPLSNLLPSAL